MRRRGLIGVVALSLSAAVAATEAARATAPRAAGLSELRAAAERSRAEQLRATHEYKASLERLLALREDEVQRAVAQAERSRTLLAQGLVARAEVDTSERRVAEARARLDQTWSEALIAASLIAKALAAEELATALPQGSEQSTPLLVRYHGRRPWALSLTRTIEDFFTRTFGRTLPVSAYGQTPVHDRLGFDHRNAIDVAVHPDSHEGRAVMAWLRGAGLSFIAFRGPVTGTATGAHIHIGEPSQRLTAPHP